MIQLENVHKSYGQTKVLKGIDLQIQDQDDVVILGPSGSGKSTLLNVLSGLEKVDEGHILKDKICLNSRMLNWRPLDVRRLPLFSSSIIYYRIWRLDKM